MLILPKVFGDDALFLHSSKLDIRGTADAGAEITVALCKKDELVGEWKGTALENGRFSVSIDTPAASFDQYDIFVRAGDEEHKMSGVLFGELWLACGQSNMEMSHLLQPEWPQIKEIIKDKHIRVFNQPRLLADAEYPFDPVDTAEGGWRRPDDERMVHSSAVASAFSYRLYDFFAARGEACPVGFLNSNRGGTNIETWIPKEAFAKNERIAYRAPSEEWWNTRGSANYQQPSAHYNHHMEALIGVKARGMLWYQGESNVGQECGKHLYKDFMKALRESYKERYAADENEIFPMISVQIFTWKYSDHCDTKMGYLNKAFSDMAKLYPDEYPFVPICDLNFIWGKWGGNHPIHPIHKYRIGDRLALLAENKFYGREKKNKQTLPPMLKSCVRHGNKLRLTFENVGDGLFVKGSRARCLYVRSKEGAYTPAYCDVVAKNVLNVYHPYIEKPCHVAYAVSSMEPDANIFAGEFPVTPFCTEFDDKIENTVRVSLKPWLNNELDSAFVGEMVGTYFDFFKRAIFEPSNGSGVCYDSDFAVTTRSVRVYSLDHSNKTFGAYVRASQYATLDLENYKEMKFKLFHHQKVTAELVLHYKEKDGTKLTHKIKAVAAENGSLGWYEHSVDLSAIPEGVIEKMEFRFTRGDECLSYVFVDDIVLVPKK